MERTSPSPRYGYEALAAQMLNEVPITELQAPFHSIPGWHEVVITAGGTQEPIDDVRYVGNFSGGRFGHALATEYVRHGHNVTLLAPKSVTDRLGIIDRVTHRTFTSAESLRTAMLGIRAADLVLHGAAVADYTPKKVAGKISSDQDSLTIEMERTPKILPLLRNHFGNTTTIVGFKLLSGVSVSRLTEVARKQIADNHTNYSIANLLDDIDSKQNRRSILLINPTGYQHEIMGKTSEVAAALYKVIVWKSRNGALRG